MVLRVRNASALAAQDGSAGIFTHPLLCGTKRIVR